MFPPTSVTATNPLFWSQPQSIPPHCQEVVPLEVELTHQIRGQLLLINFPLVGDTIYGGAVNGDNASAAEERLALHCYELSFCDVERGDWRGGMRF